MDTPFWHIFFGPDLRYGREDEDLREYSLSDVMRSALISFRSCAFKEPISEFDWSLITSSQTQMARDTALGHRFYPDDLEPPPYSPSGRSSLEAEDDTRTSIPPDIRLNLSQDDVSEMSSDPPQYSRTNSDLLSPGYESPTTNRRHSSYNDQKKPRQSKRFSFNLPSRSAGRPLSLTVSNVSQMTVSSGISSLGISERKRTRDSASSKARTGSPPRFPTPPTPDNGPNNTTVQHQTGLEVPRQRHLSASSLNSSVSISATSSDPRGTRAVAGVTLTPPNWRSRVLL